MVKTMYQPLPTITEDLDLLQTRLRSERDPQLRPRLHLLVLLKSGQATTRCQAADHLALITASATPFCFCAMQKHLTI